MKKMKAIIVDDERLARVNLMNLLKTYTHIILVAEAGSCREAINVIELYEPDVVFLDIQLMGETGFDILEHINPDIQIVFVTAFDEYAIRAFEINAVDYLLKPVNPKRLADTISRIESNDLHEKQSITKFNYDDSVFVKLNSNISKFIKISSIINIAPVGNHTKLSVNDNKNYIVLKTLKHWEEELPKSNFVRIHRSTIVNIDYIMRIERYSVRSCKLYLKNNDNPFEISRRCLINLKKIYKI